MIPKNILEEIAAHARRGSPREACGFISKQGDLWETHPIENASENPEHEFVMDAQGQIDAMREIRNSGAELFGTYHSHPKSPPVPSTKDMQLSLYPDLVHVISSPRKEEPEFGLWRISDSGYEELSRP